MVVRYPGSVYGALSGADSTKLDALTAAHRSCDRVGCALRPGRVHNWLIKKRRSTQAVSSRVKAQTRSTASRRNVGSYVLRHSLAVDLLGKGASLDEVGDLLRHRSRMTTTICARYDIDALRSVARPWPQHGGSR